jgi:hypothetical protein
VHGPQYINVYHNPVVNFQAKKRSLSRATRARKAKKGQVVYGDGATLAAHQLNDHSFAEDASAREAMEPNSGEPPQA